MILFLFIAIPLIELALFMTLGEQLGIINTIAIIIITGFLGAKLTKSQGLKALSNFRQATASGQLPHKEITDGLMILVAGAVLLTPGFLTDAIGFALLIPQVRALLRSRLAEKLKDKIHVSPPSGTADFPPEMKSAQRSSATQKKNSSLDDGKVIDV